MRYLIKSVMLTAGLMLSGPAGAQSAADPKQWVEEFLETLVNRGADRAYRRLEESHIGRLNAAALAPIRGHMEAAEQAYGRASGYEFVYETRVGSALVVYSYYVKRDLTPVLWEFILYERSGKWDLVNFALSDEMSALHRW